MKTISIFAAVNAVASCVFAAPEGAAVGNHLRSEKDPRGLQKLCNDIACKLTAPNPIYAKAAIDSFAKWRGIHYLAIGTSTTTPPYTVTYVGAKYNPQGKPDFHYTCSQNVQAVISGCHVTGDQAPCGMGQ